MPRVVVAIDGSEHATRALVDAVGLFGRDAHYVLASVVPSSLLINAFGGAAAGEVGAGTTPGTATHGTATGSMPFAPTPDGVAEGQQRAYDFFREAHAQAASTAGIDAETVIDEARPRKRRIGKAICEIAAENDADVIVVGSHGSSYAGETMLGSVSQYVLHNAGCPVLVTRSTG